MQTTWHPAHTTEAPTTEQFIEVIEQTGKEFALKASPNYWACEDMERAAYFKTQLRHLRAMHRAAKAGSVQAACRIFRSNFRRVSDCMLLSAAVRRLS